MRGLGAASPKKPSCAQPPAAPWPGCPEYGRWNGLPNAHQSKPRRGRRPISPPAPKATSRRRCGECAAAYKPSTAAGTASGMSVETASPARRPAAPIRTGPVSPSSRTTKDANSSSAASTCANSSVENGSNSVPRPRIAAHAVPSPGSNRSTVLRTRTSSRSDGRTTAQRPICQIARSGTPVIAAGYASPAFAVRRHGAGGAEDEVPRRRPEVHERPLGRVDVSSDANGVACLRGPAVDGRTTRGERPLGGVVRGLRTADRLHRQGVGDPDRAQCDRRENSRALHGRTISRAAAPSPRARLTRGPGRECLALLPSGPDAVRKLPHHGAWPEQTAPGTGAV